MWLAAIKSNFHYKLLLIGGCGQNGCGQVSLYLLHPRFLYLDTGHRKLIFIGLVHFINHLVGRYKIYIHVDLFGWFEHTIILLKVFPHLIIYVLVYTKLVMCFSTNGEQAIVHKFKQQGS